MSIMLLIPLIPIAALITQNVIILNNIILRKADLQSSDLSVLKSDEQVFSLSLKNALIDLPWQCSSIEMMTLNAPKM